jgi:hypothetical protein
MTNLSLSAVEPASLPVGSSAYGMNGEYSPYDARLPADKGARVVYVLGHPELTESDQSLLVGILAAQKFEEAGKTKLTQQRTRIERGARRVFYQLTTRPWYRLPFGHAVLKFVLGRRHYNNLMQRVFRPVVEQVQQDVQNNLAPAIARELELQRRYEGEFLTKKRLVLSLPAKAIWNALGGRRETYPRFVEAVSRPKQPFQARLE